MSNFECAHVLLQDLVNKEEVLQKKLELKNKRGKKQGDAKWENDEFVQTFIAPGEQPDFSNLEANPSNFARVQMKRLCAIWCNTMSILAEDVFQQMTMIARARMFDTKLSIKNLNARPSVVHQHFLCFFELPQLGVYTMSYFSGLFSVELSRHK